jgi:hypothetical protein
MICLRNSLGKIKEDSAEWIREGKKKGTYFTIVVVDALKKQFGNNSVIKLF